jgi:hypothetical protein
MELWKRWVVSTAFVALLPGICAAVVGPPHHPEVDIFFLFFSFLVWGFSPGRFGGTGLETFVGVPARRDADPSLLFTLSLPVRRRALYLYRSISGVLAMETAAAAAWTGNSLLLVHLGASWHALLSVLWVLPALVPFYFLDSLLLIRFSEMATMQIQGLIILVLVLAPHFALGVPFEKMVTIAFGHFTPVSVSLTVCLLSAVFAAATVWCLDQQNF